MEHREINKDTLSNYCYENGELCREIKAIVLSFHGLFETGLGFSEPNDVGNQLAEHGILYLMPYYGSTSWMNDVGVRVTDTIVKAVMDKYNLPENIRIVSTGLSMGGLAALTYPRFTKYKQNIAAVAANCPVCDLKKLAAYRPGIMKTIYVAFEHYEMSIDDAMCTVSPFYNVGQMPHVPYFIVQCSADDLVPKAEQADVLVPKMLEAGLDVTYVIVHNREHCVMDEMTAEGWKRFVLKHALAS